MSLSRSVRGASLAVPMLALLLVNAACSSSSQAPQQQPAPTAMDNRANVVEGEEMRGGNASSIEEYLSGRVPGLQVIRDGAGRLQLRIRDNASAESEPLLIVDGTAVVQGGTSDALRAINPRDIARVEVLKDASQTAMYGSRGANGVVIIKLRKK